MVLEMFEIGFTGAFEALQLGIWTTGESRDTVPHSMLNTRNYRHCWRFYAQRRSCFREHRVRQKVMAG